MRRSRRPELEALEGRFLLDGDNVTGSTPILAYQQQMAQVTQSVVGFLINPGQVGAQVGAEIANTLVQPDPDVVILMPAPAPIPPSGVVRLPYPTPPPPVPPAPLGTDQVITPFQPPPVQIPGVGSPAPQTDLLTPTPVPPPTVDHPEILTPQQPAPNPTGVYFDDHSGVLYIPNYLIDPALPPRPETT